jgi:DNA polymerase III delta subunit
MDNDYDKIKIMYDKFTLDNVGIDYLIISIYNSFRMNYIIKYLYNKNMSYFDISKVINKKEFFVKKTLERLYGYSLYDLGKYINKLYDIDKNIKNGNDKINSFELFLFTK